jgi:hypothetical protein
MWTLKISKSGKIWVSRLPHSPQLENLEGQANNEVISCKDTGIVRDPRFT